MPAQLLPLLVRRSPRLVEDLGADLELPDVVEQRRPVEVVEVVGRQAELLAEAVRVGANPLRVTAGDPVVDVERTDELEQELGGPLRRRRLVRLFQQAQPLLEGVDGARAQRELEAGRRFVREDQRELEERPQRQQPSEERVGGGDDSRRREAHRQPPEQEDPERARRHTRDRRGDVDEPEGAGDGKRVDEQAHTARPPRSRSPATPIRPVGRSHPFSIGRCAATLKSRPAAAGRPAPCVLAGDLDDLRAPAAARRLDLDLVADRGSEQGASER